MSLSLTAVTHPLDLLKAAEEIKRLLECSHEVRCRHLRRCVACLRRYAGVLAKLLAAAACVGCALVLIDLHFGTKPAARPL